MNNIENLASAIDEAMTDEQFLEKLRSAGSKEEIVKLFADEKAIALDDGIAQEAFDKLESLRNGEELTAEELEYVAGGFFLPTPIFRPVPNSSRVVISSYNRNGRWGIRIAIWSWCRR